MADAPGCAPRQRGLVVTALRTSTGANATAFGFSIMITASFGVLQTLQGTPAVGQVLVFGIAAALAVGLIEALVTSGFRERTGAAPPEVSMLGTALNFASVSAGVGVAIAVGQVGSAWLAWPVAGFLCAGAYVLAESAEILLAEAVQRARGDPDAARERDR